MFTHFFMCPGHCASPCLLHIEVHKHSKTDYEDYHSTVDGNQNRSIAERKEPSRDLREQSAMSSPLPLVQCWRHTPLVFFCCPVHQASSLPMPSTTLSKGEGGKGRSAGKRKLQHFDSAFHLLSKSLLLRATLSKLYKSVGVLPNSLCTKVGTVCVFYSSLYAEQPKGASMGVQQSAVSTQ